MNKGLLNTSVKAVNWPAPAAVRAYYTQRCGGHSMGDYASFNLALHVGDDEECVQQNRRLLKSLTNMPGEPCWLEQVHGNVVADANFDLYEADASFTDELEKVCIVMTADCLPLLVCSQSGKQVAAIHAGWRGLLNGIIEKTLDKFAANEKLFVFLGPAISGANFEVGEEVFRQFVEKDSQAKQAFVARGRKKYMADLYALAKQRLRSYGVHDVFSEAFCTYDQEDRFFSYRRDGQTGRMASLIWIAQ